MKALIKDSLDRINAFWIAGTYKKVKNLFPGVYQRILKAEEWVDSSKDIQTLEQALEEYETAHKVACLKVSPEGLGWRASGKKMDTAVFGGM